MLLRTILSRTTQIIAGVSTVAGLLLFTTPIYAQDAKPKIRIANSALSVTSLPLIGARDWKLFYEQGLDVEIILMSPALTVPAMISGDIGYFAGVGPGVCANQKIKASS